MTTCCCYIDPSLPLGDPPLSRTKKNSVPISNGNYLALNCAQNSLALSECVPCVCVDVVVSNGVGVLGALQNGTFRSNVSCYTITLMPFHTIAEIIPRRWYGRTPNTYSTSAPCTASTYHFLVKCDSRRVNETMTTNYLASAGFIYSSRANEWTMMTTTTTQRFN